MTVNTFDHNGVHVRSSHAHKVLYDVVKANEVVLVLTESISGQFVQNSVCCSLSRCNELQLQRTMLSFV